MVPVAAYPGAADADRRRMTIRTRCDAHQWPALVLIAATACADSVQPDHAPTLPFAQIEWLLDHGATLNAIAFGTHTTGIAVGDVGAILVTRDAGSSWAHVESGTDRPLRAVVFADSARAVAIGAGGVLLRSEDTGVSWARVPVSSAVELRGVAFGSAGVGVAVGDSGAIQHTGDGGRTWSSAARATNSVLHAVRFTTPGSAVAVGDGGTILLSVDGGQHWTPRGSPTAAALRALYFTSATTGVAVGGDDRRWQARRVVLRTVDGGASWSEVQVPAGGRLYSVVSTSDGSLVAAGEGGATIRSSDEGVTWQASEPVPGQAPPNSQAAVTDVSNWFSSVARAGPALVAVSYLGRIYGSSDSGVTWASLQSRAARTNLAFVARAGDGGLLIGGGRSLFRSTRGAGFDSIPSKHERLNGLRFIDSVVAVSVGIGGRIERTTDGGRSWIPVESATQRNLRNVAFADESLGVAVAGSTGTGAGMVRTEDSGRSWQAHTCISGTGICSSGLPVLGIALHPSGFGLAVGPMGVVIKTTDGGLTWTRVDHGLRARLLWSVAVPDAHTAIAVGREGTVLRTADGGTTWTRVESGTAVELWAVAFGDARKGVIVGRAGTILTTTDGGFTWRRAAIRSTRDLFAVVFATPDDAFIVGAAGTVLRLRIVSGGPAVTTGGGP